LVINSDDYFTAEHLQQFFYIFSHVYFELKVYNEGGFYRLLFFTSTLYDLAD
jgi:hypothetical protein